MQTSSSTHANLLFYSCKPLVGEDGLGQDHEADGGVQEDEDVLRGGAQRVEVAHPPGEAQQVAQEEKASQPGAHGGVSLVIDLLIERYSKGLGLKILKEFLVE